MLFPVIVKLLDYQAFLSSFFSLFLASVFGVYCEVSAEKAVIAISLNGRTQFIYDRFNSILKDLNRCFQF